MVFCIFIQCTLHYASNLSEEGMGGVWYLEAGKSWFSCASVLCWLPFTSEMGKMGKGWMVLGEDIVACWKGYVALFTSGNQDRCQGRAGNVSNTCVHQCLIWNILTCLSPFYNLCKLSYVNNKHFYKLWNIASQQIIFYNIKCIIYLNSHSKCYKWVQAANFKSWPLLPVRKPG